MTPDLPDLDNFLPHLSLDCVILGFQGGNLKVLLLKMKKLDKWALPGGFIKPEEHLEAAATRVLRERTGLEQIFLQQFHIFGDPGRVDQEYQGQVMAGGDLPLSVRERIRQRHLTIGLYALVNYASVKPRPDYLSEACDWWDLQQVPQLVLDHNLILAKALETIRLQLNYQPIGLNLLPEKFTMTELQKLYEAVLDRPLDRRNFQRRILSFGILDRLPERRTGGAHKAPFLYSFNKTKYEQALRESFQGGW